MAFIKTAAAYVGRNASKAWSFMHSTPVGSSYAKWMAGGAIAGGIRGLSDNIVGEDRVSVLGGMLQGAMMGGALRGVGQLWSMRNRLGRGGSASRALATLPGASAGFTMPGFAGASGGSRGGFSAPRFGGLLTGPTATTSRRVRGGRRKR